MNLNNKYIKQLVVVFLMFQLLACSNQEEKESIRIELIKNNMDFKKWERVAFNDFSFNLPQKLIYDERKNKLVDDSYNKVRLRSELVEIELFSSSEEYAQFYSNKNEDYINNYILNEMGYEDEEIQKSIYQRVTIGDIKGGIMTVHSFDDENFIDVVDVLFSAKFDQKDLIIIMHVEEGLMKHLYDDFKRIIYSLKLA